MVMAKVVITIEDNEENGGVRVVVNPSIERLVAKAKDSSFTSAEGLAMHLARRSLEYSQKQAQAESKIIIPTIRA